MYSLFFTSKRRPFYCAGGACGLQDHSLERVLRNGRFALLRRLSILGSAEPPEQVHADAPQFGNAHGRRDPDDLGSQLRLAVGYVVFELEAVCQVSVSRRAAPSRPRSAFPRAGGRIPPPHTTSTRRPNARSSSSPNPASMKNVNPRSGSIRTSMSDDSSSSPRAYEPNGYTLLMG